MGSPPQPRTPAQRDRYARMLAAAADMVVSGGEEALAMRELAERAQVSMTALYRYFPSKSHLILAIAVQAYAAGLMPRQVRDLTADSVGGRVGEVLVRYFARIRKQDRLTAAIMRTLTDPDPSLEPQRAQLAELHRGLLVAAAGVPFTPEQERVLFILDAVWRDGVLHWLGGSRSAGEVCDNLRTAAGLLDVASVVVPPVPATQAG